MHPSPPGAGNPFRPANQNAVYRAFLASRSYDPDALYAQRGAMLRPFRVLRRVAVVGLAGALLALTVAPPYVGAAVLGAALLLWWYQSRQVRKIDAAYAQYVGAPAADRP
jgi:Flp pilus assembly protein TadB